MQDELLTSKQAATRLEKSEPALRSQRCHGRGPTSVKIDGRVFYRPTDVDAWLATQSKPSPDHQD